jgi:hypothetical protein
MHQFCAAVLHIINTCNVFQKYTRVTDASSFAENTYRYYIDR